VWAGGRRTASHPVSEVEIEPDDELEDDGGSEVVLTTVTESDGPRWHTLWTSSHLGLRSSWGRVNRHAHSTLF
jgi:hypothetical protein